MEDLLVDGAPVVRRNKGLPVLASVRPFGGAVFGEAPTVHRSVMA